MLTAGGNYWLAVVGNLGKVRKSWGPLSRILGREGADRKVLGNFYKSVSQAVLLFREETWVLTQMMEKALDSFQYRVVRRLIGKHPRQLTDGSWDYPPLAEALWGSGARGDKEFGNKETEHSRAIYCNANDSGTMLEGHSADGSKGVLAVVGTGRNRLGGDKETGF